MIGITSQDFFAIYIIIAFSLISALWMREILRTKSYQWNISSPAICTCNKCHHTFLVKSGEKLAHCPKCNDLCVVKKQKR